LSCLDLTCSPRFRVTLHLFPTRRSSDLASIFDLPHERHVAAAEMVFDHARRQVELGRDVVIVLDSLTRLARSHNTTGRGSGRTIDRKSTRLNSSHGSISYAVFCLKKKNI